MTNTPNTDERRAASDDADGTRGRIRLDGKVAIVSGAARGIGAAIAALFVAEGASVLLGDVRDELCAQTAADLGDRAVAVHLDVADADSWAQAVATCERTFGTPTVLINNAAIQPVARFTDTSEATFRQTIDVNLVGVFLGIQAVCPAMTAAGGGTIVNMSSVAGFKATTGFSAYTASKWGVRGLTKAAAVELGAANIRVNSIHPGAIDTEMIKAPEIAQLLSTQQRSSSAKAIPRFGQPDEVARMALFLASDDASYCTGSEFIVDGGTLAGG